MATRYNPIVAEGLNASRVTVRDFNTRYLSSSSKLYLKDAEAVANEVYNILTTVPSDNKNFTGERHFEPEFGSALPENVFDPADAVTAWRIMNGIISAVQRWIPTIRISSRYSTISALDTGDGFEALLVYTDSRLTSTVSSRFIVAI